MMDNLAKLSRPRTTRRAAGRSQEGQEIRSAPGMSAMGDCAIRACVVIDRVLTRAREQQPCWYT